MSEPPTILMQATDDDRTLIDPIRLADPDPPFEGTGRALSSADSSPGLDELTEELQWPWQGLREKLSGRGRRAMEVGVVLAVVLGLGLLAYQQWRASDALRGVIAKMSAGRSASHLQDFIGSPGRALAPFVTEPGLARSSREVASTDREEMENRGASLVGSNNFEDALTHYQTLAEVFPNEAVFRDVIIVLETKLKCAGTAEVASPVCL